MNLAPLILRKFRVSKNTLLNTNTVSKTVICNKTTKQSSSSSTSTSSSDDENANKKKTSSNEALDRLNKLLQQMVTEDASQNEKKLNLAQPSNKRLKGKQEAEAIKAKAESDEKKVAKAVQNVAESLGGDTKQTESELLTKLLNPVEPSSGQTSSLSDIIKGMKIEREVKAEPSKADQVRRILQQVSSKTKTSDRAREPRRIRRPAMPVRDKIEAEKIDLFGSKPLGIFTGSDKLNLKESPQLPTWQKLHEKELKLAVTHPPENYFQEMILWTDQGKIWQFPINNEFGLDEEAKVYFSDHVFLEEHLEPWCPSKGPIRHFMELVCVGLSKNSYLTAEAKREHIEWYKNYFESKKDVLLRIGAMQIDEVQPKSIDTK